MGVKTNNMKDKTPLKPSAVRWIEDEVGTLKKLSTDREQFNKIEGRSIGAEDGEKLRKLFLKLGGKTG
jgi:hypothetical protein